MLTVFVSFKLSQQRSVLMSVSIHLNAHTPITAFNEIRYILRQRKKGCLSVADNTLLLCKAASGKPDHDYFS